MSEHIVIRRPEYVAGTSEKPEVGVFTQVNTKARPTPWGKIAAGEHVWMKWTGGPIVARATVAGFHQLEDCTRSRLRATTAGFSLHDVDEYWESLADRFFGITIYLNSEQWLEAPLETPGRSYGSSWLVFPSEEERAKWLQGAPLPQLKTASGKATKKAVGARLRFLVLKRDSFTCTYCGAHGVINGVQVQLHVDHIKPVAKGGTNDISNLRTACSDCNLGKGVMSL